MTSYGEYYAGLGTGGCSTAHAWIHPEHGIDDSLDMARVVFESLPHGSGINGSWHIMQLASKPNRFHCGNTYYAMNDVGMYCHSYNFYAVVDVLPGGQLEFLRLTMYDRELACCGYGLREYLEETIAGAIDEYNNQGG